MKIAVIYYSKTGNTKHMAKCVVKGIRLVDGVDAEAYSITDVTAADLSSCDGVIIGTPTYYCSLSDTLALWLNEATNTYNLSGKLAGAFATAAYVHGGGDIAIQNILSHLLVTGAMVYSGGGACGAPCIHLGPVAIDSSLDSYMELFSLYGKRFATQLQKIHK